VPLPMPRRIRVWTAAALTAALTAVASHYAALARVGLFRQWMPALVILIGYFATGEFYVSPSPKAEAWLKQWDDAVFDPARFERWSPVLRFYLDVVYDACFLFIPA